MRSGDQAKPRFVPVKSEEQQAVLSLHRARQGFVRQRTAQANQIRGLLAEFGIVIPQGIRHIARHLPEILEDAENTLPGAFRQLLQQLGEHLKTLDELVHAMEVQIQQWHGTNEASQRVSAVAGLARSRRVRWWHRWAMPGTLAAADSLRPGLGWCLGNTLPAASRSYLVSANAAIAT